MSEEQQQPDAKKQADALRDILPGERKSDARGETARVDCRQCGKRLRIEQVTVLGFKDRESVDCPYCGAKDVYSAMCFSLTVRKD